jgi:hypothetical protein
MMDNIDDITDMRLQALEKIEKDKIRVGDLVWKTILLVSTEDHKFRKWSPS